MNLISLPQNKALFDSDPLAKFVVFAWKSVLTIRALCRERRVPFWRGGRDEFVGTQSLSQTNRRIVFRCREGSGSQSAAHEPSPSRLSCRPPESTWMVRVATRRRELGDQSRPRQSVEEREKPSGRRERKRLWAVSSDKPRRRRLPKKSKPEKERSRRRGEGEWGRVD